MPGKEDRKPITLCFKQDEFLNHTRYKDIWHSKRFDYDMNNQYSKYATIFANFTVSERFDIAFDSEEIFADITYLNKFILSEYVCYQVLDTKNSTKKVEPVGNIAEEKSDPYAEYKPSVDIDYEIYFNSNIAISEKLTLCEYTEEQNLLGDPENPFFDENSTWCNIDRNPFNNLTKIRLVVSDSNKIPSNEFFTTKMIPIKNKTTLFISSHYYKFTRLTPPYVDDCMDYKTLGYRDRDDIVSTCVNNMTLKASHSQRRQIA